MTKEETQEIQRSYKELKKMAKQQKKAKKKSKKRTKLEKKISKKEAKMRKKGVFMDEIAPTEPVTEEGEAVEVVATPWVRKSTSTMPLVEKKIDYLAERRERSTLHDLFEEKYGETLVVPETYQEFELTAAEKARLEKLGIREEEAARPAVVEVVSPGEGAAVAAEESVEVAGEEAAEAVEAPAEEEPEGKPFYHPFQLWLYNKYGKEKMIVLKILILIVSVVGFVLLLIPRLIIFVIMILVKKIKGRRAAKKLKKAEKVASEA